MHYASSAELESDTENPERFQTPPTGIAELDGVVNNVPGNTENVDQDVQPKVAKKKKAPRTRPEPVAGERASNRAKKAPTRYSPK